MINKISKIKDKHKDNWVVILLTKPSLYLIGLTRKTLFMGILLSIVYMLVSNFEIKHQVIPSNIHSLAGFVIGLLLVFRTNSSYDRWWEARKIFSKINSIILYLVIKSRDSVGENKIRELLTLLNINIFNLVYDSSGIRSENNKKIIQENLSSIYNIFRNDPKIFDKEFGNVDRKIADILSLICSLDRINTTPIPSSYSLHIKISLFAYLLTLPIGMFFGLGAYAIPLVMVLFFIIAGIEIISSEIENPFIGDPNDLPIDKFKQENENIILNNGY